MLMPHPLRHRRVRTAGRRNWHNFRLRAQFAANEPALLSAPSCPSGAGSPDYRPLRLPSHQCFSGGAHAARRSAIPNTKQRAHHAGHDSTRSLRVRPARDSYRVKNTLTKAIPRLPTRVDGLCRLVLAVGEKQPAAWVPSLAPGSARNRPRFKRLSANRPHRATIGSAFAHR